MGFSRQEYWSGLPFPSPGDLPDPGIEPRSAALQADALPSEPPGKSKLSLLMHTRDTFRILFFLWENSAFLEKANAVLVWCLASEREWVGGWRPGAEETQTWAVLGFQRERHWTSHCCSFHLQVSGVKICGESKNLVVSFH